LESLHFIVSLSDDPYMYLKVCLVSANRETISCPDMNNQVTGWSNALGQLQTALECDRGWPTPLEGKTLNLSGYHNDLIRKNKIARGLFQEEATPNRDDSGKTMQYYFSVVRTLGLQSLTNQEEVFK
jgi:hypothetical protein